MEASDRGVEVSGELLVGLRERVVDADSEIALGQTLESCRKGFKHLSLLSGIFCSLLCPCLLGRAVLRLDGKAF